jgi:aminoglycoside phosphotransferase (APT) family kinase protein
MILSNSGEIAAVVDWELCTLGDPLADVGMLMVYWGDPDQQILPNVDPPTAIPGFPTREEVASLYAERSGRDLSEIDFYVALGLWKLAVIAQGIVARAAKGAYGKDDDGSAQFAKVVDDIAVAASEAVDRLP